MLFEVFGQFLGIQFRTQAAEIVDGHLLLNVVERKVCGLQAFFDYQLFDEVPLGFRGPT